MRKTLATILTSLFLGSCSLFNQIGGAYNLSQCEYNYNSISDIHLVGINLGNTSTISLSDFATISTILNGGSLQTIPFSMTLNMDVRNPNTAAAFLNGLDYEITINDLEFTNGKIDVPFHLDPGEKKVLPLSINVDLKNLINRYSRERVAKEMTSFLGLSSTETKVSVKLWPRVMIGKTPIKSIAPIPVVFTFGE